MIFIKSLFMWTELRKEIEQIIHDHSITDKDFRPVAIDQWQNIQEKIYNTFCKFISLSEQPEWLWEYFKQDTHSISFNYNYPFDQLSKLVDNSETVWLFLNETVSEKTKFWFFEGYIKTIDLVLRESCYIDEVYVASKKYEWLICINHHDVLIATGKVMPDKVREIEK